MRGRISRASQSFYSISNGTLTSMSKGSRRHAKFALDAAQVFNIAQGKLITSATDFVSVASSLDAH